MKRIALATMLLAGCSAGSGAGSRVGGLEANADARRVGVYSYEVRGGEVALYDRYGMQLGQLHVVHPADRPDRDFTLDLADGTSDTVEVFRPSADGRFVAPVTPETALTAALADPALAPVWAVHDVRFTLSLGLLFSSKRDTSDATTLMIEDTANTDSCPVYNCSGSGCTPTGCVKPANTSLGCTNEAELPATLDYDSRSWNMLGSGYAGAATCDSNGPTDCANTYGGATKDYTTADGSFRCTWSGGSYKPECNVGESQAHWTASCGKVSCTDSNYGRDAIPRRVTCQNPGSCAYDQGTIGCTNYGACSSGLTYCTGSCVTLDTTSHCGSCGNACISGQACSSGSCVGTLLAGASCSSSSQCVSGTCASGVCTDHFGAPCVDSSGCTDAYNTCSSGGTCLWVDGVVCHTANGDDWMDAADCASGTCSAEGTSLCKSWMDCYCGGVPYVN